MSFRTPLKANSIPPSSSSKGLGSDHSTSASTIKKQLSFNNPDESIKKNRSVTFQNYYNNQVQQLYGDNNQQQSFNAQKMNQLQNNQIQDSNIIGQAIQDILQNAKDQKYQIYQQQLDRQKQLHTPIFNTPQKTIERRKQHCSNDLACSQKHLHQHQSSEIKKPIRRDLDEYNYEKTQKMRFQEQFKNAQPKEIIKTPEEKKNNKIDSIKEDKQMSEQEIQQSLLSAARGISSKTFLKIQACLKPHPVLINYCLALIYFYKDYLQISDMKLKKLENNWREIQDIFQHHAPLIQALDNVGSMLKQGRIDDQNVNKSNEYIEKIEYLIDKTKDTQMYSEIIQPLDNFLKNSFQAFKFYNKKKSIPLKQQEQYINDDNTSQFNRLDQIIQIKMKNPQIQQQGQSDLARRNTCGHLNQEQQLKQELQFENNLGTFSPDLSPIQHYIQQDIDQVPLNNSQLLKVHKSKQEQSQDLKKRRQSENVYKNTKPLSEKDLHRVAYPLDQLQIDYFKKIKKYLKRMEEIEKIKDEIWNL